MHEAGKSAVVRTRIPPTILLRSGNDVTRIPFTPLSYVLNKRLRPADSHFGPPFIPRRILTYFCVVFRLHLLSCVAQPCIQRNSQGLAPRCYRTPCEKQVTNKRQCILIYSTADVTVGRLSARHRWQPYINLMRPGSTVKIRSFLNTRLTEDSFLSVGRAACQCRKKCLVIHVAISSASSLAKDRD